MATSNKIKTTELDFDEIKQNFRTYLEGQQRFSDYNFEGAGLSILLDVLAYNTHYNALYDNLALNESFLDSASKRSSVVSKAKELGYVPSSDRCPTAVVKVVMINNQVNAPAQIEIPANARFRTNTNNTSYTFYSQESHIATKKGNQYIFDNITIKEGELLSNTFVADGISNAFEIPNTNIDTNTLKVLVQQNQSSSTYTVFTASNTLINVNGESTVYFLHEISDGKYQIEFGNGVVGKQLSAGNVITCTYLVPHQTQANGSRTFQFLETINSDTDAFVVTITPAYGGSTAESIESIKWNAPRMFTAQNRCVTLNDYSSIIRSLYPDARSINVWGGEQNTIPSYGDVFISIKPASSDTLTESEKNYILNDILGPRAMVTVHPKIVDPTYIYVELNTSFYYNPEETQRSASTLSSLVRQSILQYDNDNLSLFGGVLKYSALCKAIDSSEDSIKNSITTVKLHRTVTPSFNQSVNYVVDIGNPIYYTGVPEYSVLSTGVYVLGYSNTMYITDIPNSTGSTGKLRMFYYIGDKKEFVNRDVGVVDYNKGITTISDVIITGIEGAEFKLIFKPQSNDVASSRNQIVTIPTTLLAVTAIIDKPADNYLFTSSRN